MERLVDKVESLPDTEEETDKLLNSKLEEVKVRYESLAEKVKSRDEKVSKVAALSEKYADDSEMLKNFLDEAEKEVTKLDPVSCDEGDVIERIARAKVHIIAIFLHIVVWT